MNLNELQSALEAPIPASRIDLRVGMKRNGKCQLLAYKDARVDIERLNSVLGVFGWQREHKVINDNLYCGVSIKNPETGEWVTKWDVGTKSKTEAEKGEASDSFKRACVNIGIGVCLYQFPAIFVSEDVPAWDMDLNVAYFASGNLKHHPCAVKITSKKDGSKVYFKWIHPDFDKTNVFVP